MDAIINNIGTYIPVIIGVMAVGIVFMIVKTMQQVKEEIDKKLEATDPAKRDEYMKHMAEEIRERDVRCPSCGGNTNALFGTENQYRCISCKEVSEGRPHIPSPGA